jgi:hypothetical protein
VGLGHQRGGATTVEEPVDEQVVAESEFRVVREEGKDGSTGGVVW